MAGSEAIGAVGRAQAQNSALGRSVRVSRVALRTNCPRRGPSLLLTLVCVLLGAFLLSAAPALARKEYVPVGSFGTKGGAEGEIEEGREIAVNSSLMQPTAGDVYVLDAGSVSRGTKAHVERFNASGSKFEGEFDGSKTPAGSFSIDNVSAEIVIDNSGKPQLEDPSVGDVYVMDTRNGAIDKFSPTGQYESQLTGTCERLDEAPPCTGSKSLPFGALQDVTVDPAGNVWVLTRANGESVVDEFTDLDVFIRTFTVGFSPSRIAVDSAGNAYVRGDNDSVLEINAMDEVVTKFASHVFTGSGATASIFALAINPATNGLLVNRNLGVEVYAPTDAPNPNPVEIVEGLENYGAMAVNTTTNSIYLVQPFSPSEVVKILGYLQFPDVTTGQASGARETVATLNGSINPEGEAITECQFEYGTESGVYPNSVPCAQTIPFSGSEAVPVSAEVSGLQPRASYHFRLTARAARAKSGEDVAFFTSTPPLVEGGSSVVVSPTSVTINAQVDPSGLPTTYRVEYGLGIPYSSATAEVEAGAGFEATSVQAHLSGLNPGTAYHARIIATNEFGTTPGGDLTFTTKPVSAALTLPDSRVYEMVSPPESGDGEVYPPASGHELALGHQTISKLPVRAAADGDSIGYAADASTTGGSGSVGIGFGNMYLAKRGPSGWSARDIQPPVGSLEVFQGWSSDLSLSFLAEFEVPLTPDAPRLCEVLYSHGADESYHALFTSTATPGNCGAPQFAGVSADDSSVLFESYARLTPEATQGSKGEDRYNLYDSVGGSTYLVNVLPDGTPDVNASFGGIATDEETVRPRATGHHYGDVISSDGSRVIWTDLNTGDLYVRENPASPNASTVLVAPGGDYLGASSDGAKILFSKAGDLYEYDLETEATEDLAPGGSVLGMVGSSEDASYVYFVAEGVLASNENAHGETPALGQPNLYVAVHGETRFIATLSPEDDTFDGPSEFGGEPFWGDWRPSLLRRTAEVTPDGGSVVFTSRRPITGYDNAGEHCETEEEERAACQEVFVYDAHTEQLSCASCDPTGAPPTGTDGAFLPTPDQEGNGTYQLRTISDDGSRVFFDTLQGLVAQDTNGVQDVYEWERSGSGSCKEARGCIYLLSSNLSNEAGYLVDASSSGNDVFFTTRARLVPQDQNEQVDLYDARVSGGFPKVSTACTGTGCQGVPPASPSFATPASVTFAGAGNFPAKPAVRPPAKHLTRAQKLAKALKACNRRPKKRRASCEKQARRQFASQSKSKSHKGGK